MRRVNAILQDEEFQSRLAAIARWEENRLYCHHDLAHCLAVARIAYILTLEIAGAAEAGRREVVYAAALLHDLGRVEEYLQGEDHARAGARLIRPILERCGFTAGEAAEISAAIGVHRQLREASQLGKILHQADQYARPCWECRASATCHRLEPGRALPALVY